MADKEHECSCPDLSGMRPNEVVQSMEPCPVHGEENERLSRLLVPRIPHDEPMEFPVIHRCPGGS